MTDLHIAYDVVMMLIIAIMTIVIIKLYKLAFRDYLTGLYNTRYLYRQEKKVVRKAKKNSKKLCFFFVDLDGLKSLNDNYSYATGDKSLQKIASVLKKTFSFESDLVIRRNKGDEFICVCQTNEEVAKILAETLQERLGHLSIDTDKGNIYISATVGFYCLAPYYGVFGEAENKADADMKRNKKRRKEDMD